MISDYSCVDDRLCFGSMPTNDDLVEISRGFNLIIALEYPDYDTSIVKDKLVELYTPDSRAPCLLEVHDVLRRIEGIVNRGGRIFVHCRSGMGRSGTLAAIYLIYMYGMDSEEAIRRVRDVRPGSIETIEQELAVKEYGFLLKYLGKDRLSKIVEFGKRYDFGRGIKHAWKVLDISIQLSWLLKNDLGLREEHIANVLAPAAILHDIGVLKDEEEHHIYSYKIILEEGKEILGEHVKSVALLAKHHRARTDPLEDPEVEKWLLPYIAILRIADAADHMIDQSALYIDYRDNILTIYTTPEENIEKLREKLSIIEKRVKKKKDLLEKLLNKEIYIEVIPIGE